MHRIALLLCLTSIQALGQSTRPSVDLSHAPIAQLKKNAEKGDAAAQTEYGRRLLFGVGMKPDALNAMTWFGKAGAAGSGDALFELYLCYRDGIGEPKDEAKAAKLLNESAETKHSRAIVALAEIDLADAKDRAKSDAAFKAIAEMARQGDPTAQLALARGIARGLGPRSGGTDVVQTLLKAAAADDPRIGLAAARLFREGDHYLRPDPQRAASLLRKLAERGVREAAVDLARTSPESYRGLAKEQSIERLGRDERLIGESVRVDGELSKVESKEWSVRDGEKKPALRIVPDAAEIKNVTAGRAVRVWGLVEDVGVVRALLVEVPEPKLQIVRPEMQAPRVVKGGNKEKYVVQGELHNTGRQRIISAELEIRVFQPDSGMVATETITLKDLQPGERRPFIESFEPTSVAAPGNSTPVLMEAKVGEVEW